MEDDLKQVVTAADVETVTVLGAKQSADPAVLKPWSVKPDMKCLKGHAFRWVKAPIPPGSDGSYRRACPECGTPTERPKAT